MQWTDIVSNAIVQSFWSWMESHPLYPHLDLLDRGAAGNLIYRSPQRREARWSPFRLIWLLLCLCSRLINPSVFSWSEVGHICLSRRWNLLYRLIRRHASSKYSHLCRRSPGVSDRVPAGGAQQRRRCYDISLKWLTTKAGLTLLTRFVFSPRRLNLCLPTGLFETNELFQATHTLLQMLFSS